MASVSILPPCAAPRPGPILPPRAPCCPQLPASHPDQSDPVDQSQLNMGCQLSAGEVRGNPGSSPHQHPARVRCRMGVQDGVKPHACSGPSPTRHRGAEHRDPFPQRSEGLPLPRGSRGPGLCLGSVCGTGSRSQRHTLPRAWTAATSCTLGWARPLGLVRRHGRAHAGLCWGGGAVLPPARLRSGCGVAAGQLWGSHGQCQGRTRLGGGIRVW